MVSPGLTVPGTRRWTRVRHGLVQDLVSLTKHEMILWGGLSDVVELSEEEVAAADEPAALLQVPEVEVRAAFDTDAYRVTPVITSPDQVAQSPVEVVLR
ncbi:hypothetical protein IOD16_10255 [Saccharothrix sp. 6-C]|uniref:hypothetical protein n=1 Tax=Saccharothrix sp. 6-C TaxID=2781735 RepID=UPI0019174AFA|nr:hypothetical protein [Saccharothrix sp. 6-C]QQQ78782.1 hypothetical protein IOD16_10255 [Saccharothrix sp. 6-C]